MLTEQDIILYTPSKRAVDDAIHCALQKANVVKTKNGSRTLFKKLDDIFRGDLARECFIDWLRKNIDGSASFYDSDTVKGALTGPDDGWDIWHDILYIPKGEHVTADDIEIRGTNWLEVKSRIVPSVGFRTMTLSEVVNNTCLPVPAEDFNGKKIDLLNHSACAFLYAMYPRIKLEGKPNEEEAANLLNCRLAKERENRFRDLMQIGRRYKELYLVGWASVFSIHDYVKNLKEQTWNYYGKKQYCFPLKKAMPMKDYRNVVLPKPKA